MEKGKSTWDLWIEQALARLESHKMFAPLRPMQLPGVNLEESEVEAAQTMPNDDEYETSQRLQPWDRLSIQISLPDSFFKRLLTGGELIRKNELADYKAVAEHGTGPRGSPLICGYTNYHRALESSLAKLKKKEACLLTSSGFAANMAVMVAIGSLAPLLSVGKRPTKEEKIAIFSDSLNHASIVDGIKLAERHGGAQHFVYKHNDMFHLDQLLTHCKNQRKVVVTDSLFSMDGDFAPMVELVQLRKKHGFLFVVDDAHGTFVWGKNGGGVPEEFNCEYDVDISVGTLSKAAGSLGGFITCSKTWKQFFQSRGRSFIFSTIAPVPLTAASLASVVVSRKEPWRRMEIRKRMKEFQTLTGIPVTSQIVSVIVGSTEKTFSTSWELLKAGFYVVPVGPPAVPPNTGRLRITLTAAHTSEDIKRLVKILSDHISFSDINNYSSELYARL
ncbi:Aminotransferase, class I/classII [Corchorus capsularis]|uniref:Aminotransferase, class I/classII n=1 Tax=Corchorus capsularis TaxID=210143 RepID=A0A1R3JJ53_COCAP|nr:Aminotransferase, class I/classII [Corchorus capsularis]